MRDPEILSRLLLMLRSGVEQKKFFAGFDGFVDNVTHVIDRRINAEEYIRINSLREYGQRLKDASGLSTTIEQHVLYKKTGGNGPIFTTAMLNMEQKGTYVGALGQPLNEVFQNMSERAKLYSVTEPAYTYALEFDDGKAIIVNNLSTFNQINLKNLLKIISKEELKSVLKESDLIAFVNWTTLLYVGEIIDYVISEIMPSFSQEKFILFDLIDPVSRSENDLSDVLAQIKMFGPCCKAILSMNVKEAQIIAKVLQVYDGDDITLLAKEIGLCLGIHASVVHAIKEVAAMIDEEFYQVDGAYCDQPKLLTGAGDNFNAGFCLGLLQGWPPDLCLCMGGMASGYYVRSGNSGTIKEIEGFIDQWLSY